MAEDGKIVYRVVINLDGVVESSERAGEKISDAIENGTKDAPEKTKKHADLFGEVWVGAARKIGEAFVNMTAKAAGAAKDFVEDSVKVGAEFNSAMSQVVATMGYSIDELNDSNSEAAKTYEELRGFAQEMGSTTMFSASQAAEALNYMALAGYDAKTSMKMLPSVLNLAAAGGIELAAASDMVTDAQSALGLSLDETSEMIDQMALTSSKTNTSVAQLGEAILTIGATARDIKGGTTELSTVLGVLADNGIKGAEGGTHLRNIIMSLKSPTQDGAEALKALNVAVYDSDGNMRSLIDIISDLQTGLGDMDQASRDTMINGIFNKVDAAAVNALLNTTQERFGTLTKQIDNARGAAEKMAEVQLDNLSGDVVKFQSALEGAQIAVSDMLEPALRGIVQTGTDAISQLTTAMQAYGIKGAIEVAENLLGELVESLLDGLPDMLDAGLSLLESVLHGISEALPQAIPVIAEVIGKILESLASHAPELLIAGVELLIALLTGLINAIPTLVDEAPRIVRALWDALVDHAPELIEAGIKLIGALINGISTAAIELPRLFLDYVSEIYDIFEQTDWGEVGSNIVEGIKNGIMSLWDDLRNYVVNAASDLWESVKNFFGIHSPSTKFKYIGEMSVEGTKEGFEDGQADLTRTVRNLYSNVGNAATAALTAAASTPALSAASYASAVSYDMSSNRTAYGGAATFNITVQNIDELNELLDWYKYREITERMV